MPIISIVGRKATSVRVVIGIIYALLILGSVTVLYPFVLMLSISLCSAVDVKELRVVPEYVYRDDALFLKYVNDRYGYFQNMVYKEGTNIDNLKNSKDGFNSLWYRLLPKFYQNLLKFYQSPGASAYFKHIFSGINRINSELTYLTHFLHT